jgi:hypothetical protein
MELKDFIKETLISITNGVSDANKITNRFEISGQRHDGKSRKYATDIFGEYVEFDVSVIASENIAGKTQGKIGVALANLGSEIDAKQDNQTAHRLKFRIFIMETEPKL